MKNFPAKVMRRTSVNPVLLAAGEASGANDNKPLAEISHGDYQRSRFPG